MKETAKTPRRPGAHRGKEVASAVVPAETEQARRQLEESVSWTGRERLRCLWYRLRLTVHEMNDANRRMLELRMRLP